MVEGLMVSATMAVQDQNEATRSNSILPAGNGISLSAGLDSVTSVQLKEQFSCENDYAPKVRKPYTITKQRERWTEEEHKKFLEALKLYGRAWRRIEEHVGTKTAVQIRSHAQKFFSKVVRESNGSNTSSVEPIEIPPPRPKRKPMHPYPRKLLHPLNKEPSNLEQPKRSTSPSFFVSEQENQSPTSVLSAVGSDTLGSTDSSTPNSSLSPVSPAAGVHAVVLVVSEANPSPEENRSPSPAPVTAASVPDEQPPMKFELFPKENVFAKEGSAEDVSTRSVKLFGRTVLVTDSHRPSPPSLGTCKSLPSDVNEGKPVQTLPWNFMGRESSPANMEYTWGHLPQGAPGALYFMEFQNENSNPIEAGCAAPLPWWTLYGGVPFPLQPFHAPESMKTHLNSIVGEVQDKEIPKEGSWTGSNTGSVDEVDIGDKNSDVETQSPQVSFDKEEKEPVFQFKWSDRSTSSELRTSPEKCMQGFVPYKRCLAERDTQSSTITGEEREEQRICLSL